MFVCVCGCVCVCVDILVKKKVCMCVCEGAFEVKCLNVRQSMEKKKKKKVLQTVHMFGMLIYISFLFGLVLRFSRGGWGWWGGCCDGKFSNCSK